jgi:hypothetical protein
LKKYSIHLVLFAFVLVSIAVSTFVTISIFSDNRDKIIRKIYEAERKTRDSLHMEIQQIKRDGTLIQYRIDSLMGSIMKTDSVLITQLNRFKHDIFKDVRNYRDSTNSAILERLRANR